MALNLYGIISTLLSTAAFRSYVAKRQGIAFDRRYGTDTFTSLPLSAMDGVDGGLLDHAVQYEVSAIPKFNRAMSSLRRAGMDDPGQYSFIDVGSGKGLIVMLAARQAFKGVYGVEMAPALHEIAGNNVRIFEAQGASRSPITLSCGNALTYQWPDGNVIVYLYNPFDEELTSDFIDRIVMEARRGDRRVSVVYVNPVHKSLFERLPAFRPIYSDRTLCVYEYIADALNAGREER
jgi:hypothetical protein